MKKYHSILSLILACVLVLGLCASASAAGNYGPDVQVDKEKKLNYPGNGNYDSNWMYWSQGASKHEKMRGSGCYAIALSKLIVDAGLKDSSEFTPDDHYRWGRDNDYLTAGCAVKNPTAMIEKYTGADVTVKTEDGSYSYDKINKRVMELLNDGYYVILFRPKGNSYNKHYVYVCRDKSLDAGKTIISGSQSDIHSRTGSIYSLKSPYGFRDPLEKKLLAPLDELGYKNYITQIVAVKVHSKGTGTETIKTPQTSNTNNKGLTVAFSNYQVRELAETSAEPYATVNSSGAKVTEVGMYIGPTKDKLTKLGSDNGKAGYKKNMWYNTVKYGYPLEPGTTYYYQPYAVVDGKTYWGAVKDFTTLPGEKPVVTPAPATPTPVIETSAPATPTPIIKDPPSPPPTPTPQTTVTFSNYQVRELTSTTAEPYATATASSGKVARVGMYIGTDKNNLTQLGTDNGTPKPYKNMWYNTTKYGYTIKPNTTYYYQPFAEVDGTRYYGDIKSFTTPDVESMVTFSNYQVRKLTATSAEPYATATAKSGKVARVGMYIGTDKNNLTQLGTDNGTPKPYKNMWYNTTKYNYTIKPNTTYYYQPFAEVDGTRYYGEIRSFTTPQK